MSVAPARFARPTTHETRGNRAGRFRPVAVVPLVLFWWLLAVRVACRVPPRRPGNFHLRPQMKVTKAKGLNATPYGSLFALRTPGPAGHLDAPKQLAATAHSTGPRFALALGPADQRGRGFARPAPPGALQVGCAALFPSGPLGRGSAACRTHERCCVKGLCFGDFHLAPQMKVTRPPGRDPAGWQATNARRAERPQRAGSGQQS